MGRATWPSPGLPEIVKVGRTYKVRAYNPRHHRTQVFKTRSYEDALHYWRLCTRWQPSSPKAC